MSIAFQIRTDEITPSLAALADDNLKRGVITAMATVVSSFAQRAFDEPSLRPSSWPARKSKATNPLLKDTTTLQQSIHMQIIGNDSAKVGLPSATGVYGAAHQLGSKKKNIPARPFFPVIEDQLTGNAQAEIQDVVDILVGKAAS